LIGCGSSNPLIDEAKSSIQSQNPQAALESAEQSIQEFPNDPLGYYYKAVALGEIAGNEPDPAMRTDYYEQMNEAFSTAEAMADTMEQSPSEIGNISSVRGVLWQTEHNKGVQFVQDDSLKNTVDNPMSRSVQHLKNATILQPDSSLSWNVLSQVATMDKNYEEAAKAKTRYIEIVPDSSVTPNDHIQLASFYYNLEQQQKVVEVFEKAQEQYPDNQDIVSNLADAYNRIGEPEKAISTVERLVEQNPENPRFHLVLGTQIYQKALEVGDTVSANSDEILQLQRKLSKASGDQANQIKQQIADLEQENAELQPRVDELTDRAEEELNLVLEYNSESAQAYNTLGVIYQNKAKAVFDMRNRTTEDNAKAKRLDDKGKELLRKSMGYYESATEIEPDNQDYWRSLFSIYTTLGMDEKAKEAMNKAGIN
jgi:tetratricopeptide (TPR) repeat protein